MAYAIGATFGGMSGAFLGAYDSTVNASQFEFSFSIFVLAMVIVGGLGSIWGAVMGALLLSYINYYLIPDVSTTCRHVRAQLQPHRPVVRDLRLPPRPRDDPPSSGTDPGAKTNLELTKSTAPTSCHGRRRDERRRGRDGTASDRAGQALMRVEQMSKQFGGLVAVNDVSVDIPLHSIVSIIGPNGAGKTTLFNMLTGLYRPSAGRIFFRDHDITGKRPDVISGSGSRGRSRTSGSSAR